MHYCETGTCEIADPGECPQCFHPITEHGHDGCRHRVTWSATSLRGVEHVDIDDCYCLQRPAHLIAEAVTNSREN